MGTLNVQHPIHGHATLTWDATDAKSVAETKAAFDELISHSMVGIVGPAGHEEATRVFDPQAEEITVISNIKGG